jgi:hypothetical protein
MTALPHCASLCSCNNQKLFYGRLGLGKGVVSQEKFSPAPSLLTFGMLFSMQRCEKYERGVKMFFEY